MPATVTAVTKVCLHGPRPWGGSYISTIEDPVVARLVADGWKVTDAWDVEVGTDGRPFVAYRYAHPAEVLQ